MYNVQHGPEINFHMQLSILLHGLLYYNNLSSNYNIETCKITLHHSSRRYLCSSQVQLLSYNQLSQSSSELRQ